MQGRTAVVAVAGPIAMSVPFTGSYWWWYGSIAGGAA